MASEIHLVCVNYSRLFSVTGTHESQQNTKRPHQIPWPHVAPAQGGSAQGGPAQGGPEGCGFKQVALQRGSGSPESASRGFQALLRPQVRLCPRCVHPVSFHTTDTLCSGDTVTQSLLRDRLSGDPSSLDDALDHRDLQNVSLLDRPETDFHLKSQCLNWDFSISAENMGPKDQQQGRESCCTLDQDPFISTAASDAYSCIRV